MHCFEEQEKTWYQSIALDAEELDPVVNTLKGVPKVCH